MQTDSNHFDKMHPTASQTQGDLSNQTKPSNNNPLKENFLHELPETFLVNSITDFQALRDEWNTLNDLSPKSAVFNSWEWLFTWWEIYKDDGNRELFILKCVDTNQQVVGIAPFQIINHPKRYFPCNKQIIFLGTGETDDALVFGEYMDLLIKTGYEASVIDSISTFLHQHKSLWDGAKFHQLLNDSYLSRLFEKHQSEIKKSIVANGFRTYINLPETYKDYLMSLQKKKRNNITRIFSRLEAEQNFTIETVSDANQIQAGISTLANLNLSRRESLSKPSVFSFERFVSFHRKLADRLYPLNKIELRIMRIDNEPVAALYSFLDNDFIHVYQSGMEDQLAHRYSLMTTMLTQLIRHSIESNPQIKHFNFMYAEHEDTYKKRYSSETEAMFDVDYDQKTIKFSVYQFLHGPVKTQVKKIIAVTRKAMGKPPVEID